MRTDDRSTLAAITTVAVLAASVVASLMPGEWLNPLLTWAVAYVAAVLGSAHLAGLPPGRTLVAASLLVAAALQFLLAVVRAAVEGLIAGLSKLDAYGRHLLANEALTSHSTSR